MDIKDIVKNAPEGATHYGANSEGKVMSYYQKHSDSSWSYLPTPVKTGWSKPHWITGYPPIPLPKLKNEYLKVEGSIFHPKLQSDFESGLLFCSSDGEKFVEFIGDERALMRCRLDNSLYRYIETVMDEREEFIERAGDILPEFDKRTNPMWAGKLYDAGCRFVGE